VAASPQAHAKEASLLIEKRKGLQEIMEVNPTSDVPFNALFENNKASHDHHALLLVKLHFYKSNGRV
jgi:hypothetical protein